MVSCERKALHCRYVHSGPAHPSSALVFMSEFSFSMSLRDSETFFFLFCNIFVTGFPVKFGLLSPERARQRRCRAYPGDCGNRILFDGGGNRSARRKPPVRDPRRKSLSYGATYLVPRAGIEPTTPHRHWLQARNSDTSDALNHSATKYPLADQG
jgi:hypothetical protein